MNPIKAEFGWFDGSVAFNWRQADRSAVGTTIAKSLGSPANRGSGHSLRVSLL